MLRFFNKKKKEETWYSFFETLFQYCDNEENEILVAAGSYKYMIEYISISFPYYYRYPEEIKRFEAMPYDSMYEILNIIYKKGNIGTIDVKEAEQKNYQYAVWKIRIPQINEQESLHFLIFFLEEDNGKKTYRIFYYYSVHDRLQEIVKHTNYLELNELNNTSNAPATHFMTAMVSLAKFARIDIPDELQLRFKELEVNVRVTVEDFERVITLCNINPYDRDIKSMSQELFDVFKTQKPSYPVFSEDEPDDTSYNRRFDILNIEDNCWISDWKFDPEDAEGFIQDILLDHADFNLNYPEDTYSHELFPYINKDLSKLGFALMNVQTWGDDYMFFIVRKENVNEILSLSNRMVLCFELIK